MRIHSIKVKLFLLIFSIILLLSFGLWLASSNIIAQIAHKNHLDFAKQEFVKIIQNIGTLEKELTENSQTLASDSDLVLNVNLISKYENIENYKSLIFDEQKKKLLKIIDKHRKLSASDEIALYNSKGELILYQTPAQRAFVSFGNGGRKYLHPDMSPVKTPQVPVPLHGKKQGIYFSSNDHMLMSAVVPVTNRGTTVGYVQKNLYLDDHLFTRFNKDSFCLALQDKSRIYTQSSRCAISALTFNSLQAQSTDDEEIKSFSHETLFIYDHATPYPFTLLATMPKDDYLQALTMINKQLLVIIALVTLAVAMLSYLFAQKIFLNPFRNFYEGFKELRRGNYTHNISVKSKDEIGQLAAAFNQMSGKIAAEDRAKTKNYEEVILALVDIIEQRDTYTAGHSQRVSRYCQLIAKSMGLDEASVKKLAKAAMLHDIGKIQTPDTILLKPAKLNSLEYRLIQEHVSISDEILSKLTMYKDLAQIVKYHHERFDGKGYPFGVKGKKIPLLSRIMIVADAFDAMTTNRIYKPRMDIDQALEELERNSGTQFDPDIVAHAKDALKDVVITDEISQLPRSDVERERFAYFFKDRLTDLYNLDYLQTLLNKRVFSHKKAFVLMLKNFSEYNNLKGWEEGNRYLQNFSAQLQRLYPDTPIFRVEGDDFVLISDEIDKERIKKLGNETIYVEIAAIELDDVNSFHDLKKAY